MSNVDNPFLTYQHPVEGVVYGGVTLMDAIKDGRGAALDKSYNDRNELRSLIDSLPTDDNKLELENAVMQYEGCGGRDRLHIARLIQPDRSTIEQQFGVALLRYADIVLKKVFHEDADMKYLTAMVRQESEDTIGYYCSMDWARRSISARCL